jgi:hypothetical protein
MPAKAGIHYSDASETLSKHFSMDTGFRRYDAVSVFNRPFVLTQSLTNGTPVPFRARGKTVLDRGKTTGMLF